MRRKAREYALQILYALDLNPAPTGDFLKVFWEMNEAKPEIIEYASVIVKGTLANQEKIDALQRFGYLVRPTQPRQDFSLCEISQITGP